MIYTHTSYTNPTQMQSFLLPSWALGDMVSTINFSYILETFKEHLMKIQNEINAPIQ